MFPAEDNQGEAPQAAAAPAPVEMPAVPQPEPVQHPAPEISAAAPAPQPAVVQQFTAPQAAPAAAPIAPQAAAAPAPKPAVPAGPPKMLVLDTTATVASGKRVHEQIINGARQSFTFEPNVALELDAAVALKFLRHDAFKLVQNGQIVDKQRRPKQPDELEAGEKVVLQEHETIARLDELSTKALFTRAVEMPGGEVFAQSPTPPDRNALITFIMKRKADIKKANLSKKKDVADDEFVPEAELTGNDGDFD